MKYLTPKITLIAALAAVGVTASAQTTVLQPLTTFGTNGDGTLRPNDIPYLTSASQLQRGLAYNPTTGHLLLVDRSANSSANCDVHILDGATGAYLGKLDNSSILAGGTAGFALNMVGVADDGAIFAANLSSGTAGAPQLHLYRWNDEGSFENIVSPTAGFPTDDPSNGNTNNFQKRWGDLMVVRGAGLNTQILFANRGTLACLYTPDDASYSHFSPKTLTNDVQSGGLGWGLSFGDGNTFWGTSGANGNGPLLHLAFDTTAGTGTTLTNIPSPRFPGTVSPFLVMPSSNLLVGLTMVSGADAVRLYDISNTNSPVLLDRKNFATGNNNNNFVGSVTLGTNGVVYVLDADNGIMAFTLANATTNPLAPAFFLQPANTIAVAGGNTGLASGADSSQPVNYQWYLFDTNALPGATNASLTFTNVQSTNGGSYTVVASNSIGSVTSVVAVLTVNLAPPSTLLGYEPFPYTVGTLIGGQGNWFTSAGAGAVSNSSLTVPGLASSSGNMLSWGTTTVSMRRTNDLVLSGTIYCSFIYQLGANSTIPAPGASGGSIAGMVQGNTSTYFAPKINIRTNSSAAAAYDMGVFKGGGEANGAFATNLLFAGQNVFVVARYTFNDGTSDDTCDLWVAPDPSTFGTTNIPPSSATTINPTLTVDQTSGIDRFFFRQSSGPSRTFADEVRVGLTWADVTPVNVATPTLNITNNSNGTVTLLWPTAATGYNPQSATSLGLQDWSPVTNSIIVSGTNSTVTVNASATNQFFRLKK